MIFDGWESIGRIVVLASGAYVLLVAALRVSGSQALAKMSAYDLVITIALGSIVATVPLGMGVTLADGLAVIATYLGLQALMRKSLKRSTRLRDAIKNPPRLVVWDGALLPEEMQAVDVTDAEIRAAIRKSGHPALADVQAVVLENDGQWSVIGRTAGQEFTALRGVHGAPPHRD